MVVTGEQHHRVTRVLRLQPGDALCIFDGRGHEFEAVIESADRGRVTLRVLHAVRPVPEPGVRITLFQSVPRGDAMERVIQKCIEVGVAEIVPLVTRRTVARPRAGAEGNKLARWRKIALHAVEQSGRAWLVPVAEPVPAEGIGERLSCFDLALVPHTHQTIGPRCDSDDVAADVIPSEAERSQGSRLRLSEPGRLRNVLTAGGAISSAAIVIGPEGGFEPAEIERFSAAGARIVSLGPRVLRSETAGLVAAAIVLYHFGEMG